jgi:ADP-ribosylation factor GTPase-activating protein 1
MDAFKQNEILRMQYGGNKAWQTFYDKNTTSLPFDEATIRERYDSEVGEEWKERLSCQVEEREFDKAAFQKERQAILQKQASRSATPSGGVRNNAAVTAVSNSGPGSRTASPAPKGRGITAEQKAQNEAFFSRMGDANASRPDNLAPSQGGKYGGFGSAMPEPSERQAGDGGIADDFSKDAVAALTKGFGWFGGLVSKQAKMVNDSIIQPTAKNVSCPHSQPCSGGDSILTFNSPDRLIRLRRTSAESRPSCRARPSIRRPRRGAITQQIRRGPG